MKEKDLRRLSRADLLEMLIDQSKEVQILREKLEKAEAELKKAYPDNDEILDEYQSADIELHNLSNRNEFRKGFKVGAQLVLEMIKPIK